MRFIPTTRQVELDYSSPEGLVKAYTGSYFYRTGNDEFYLEINNTYERIPISKKSMAVQYYTQAWYPTITNESIVFSHPYELWIKKTGSGTDKGWQFLSYNSPVASLE